MKKQIEGRLRKTKEVKIFLFRLHWGMDMKEAILQAEKVIAEVEKLGILLSKELQGKEAYDSLFGRVNFYIEEFRKLRKEFENYKLRIPFIGHFSSGKSSLINSFLGYDLLDVDIKPETDKPYEIFYSPDPVERVEKVEVGKRGEIEVLKVGYHFDVLKNYPNIVLVDLPGLAAEIMNFSSEDKEKIERIIKSHNLITRHYLFNANFYVLVVDVSKGSLGKDLIEFVKIKENVPFVVLLHKADKIPFDKRNEIKNHILKELSPLKPCLVEFTSINDINGLRRTIELADRLYSSIKVSVFRERLVYLLEEILDKVDGIKYSLNVDVDFIESVLEEIESEVRLTQERLKRIIDKRENAIKSLIEGEKRNSEKFFNDEARIKFWAKHIDNYEKDVSDFVSRLLDRLTRSIKNQISSMQSDIEMLFERFEGRLRVISGRIEETSDRIRKVKAVTKVIDIAKIMKKIALITKLLSKLEKLLKLSKIFKMNPITWILDWIVGWAVEKYAEKKIKEANEEILYKLKDSLDEVLQEVEEIFLEIRNSIDLNEELEEKRKELEAVRKNRDKIKKFSGKVDSILDSLKIAIESMNKVEKGDSVC